MNNVSIICILHGNHARTMTVKIIKIKNLKGLTSRIIKLSVL